MGFGGGPNMGDFMIDLSYSLTCMRLFLNCALTPLLTVHGGSLPMYVSIFPLIVVYACPDSHMCMIYPEYSLIYSSIAMIASILLVGTRLRDLEGCYGFCRTFPMSNWTPEPNPIFRRSPFSNKESHLGFFFLILFTLLKIKQK